MADLFDERYEQLANEQKLSDMELPPLQNELNWLQRFFEEHFGKYRDQINHWLEKAKDWINSMFGDSNLRADFKGVGHLLWQIVWIFAIVVLVASLAWLFYSWWIARQQSTNTPSLRASQDPWAEIRDQIQALCKSNNWSAAARLQWLLFLRESGSNISLTLQEFVTQRPESLLSKRRSETTNFYQLMFSEVQNPSIIFQRFQESLEVQRVQ